MLTYLCQLPRAEEKSTPDLIYSKFTSQDTNYQTSLGFVLIRLELLSSHFSVFLWNYGIQKL